jgi:DNA mismatch repair protein MutS
LGNDNLFKGLSTFAVEMSELRTILKMANNTSLILGDELCSGTETESAISIFISGLQLLSTRNSSFIFATHFHEIINYEEITNMDRLKLKHLSVYYDRETDSLVYDRKLKDGSGTRMYGLEVCKSLYLPEDFLQNAYSIRNKYFPETNGELVNKTSTYNAKKIKGMCEICKTAISEEVHHLQPQKDANKDGFIGNFHKNHVANLLNVCEKCHNEMHCQKNIDKPVRIIKKKTTKGYIITNTHSDIVPK